jgi:hypothetical protein
MRLRQRVIEERSSGGACVLEMGLAAEELDIRAVQEAGADGVVGEAVHVLEQVKADHETGRQSGPADTLAVERAEGGGKAIPVDQLREVHQRMAAVDEVHQGRAEEFGLLGRRRYGRHRRAPARRHTEGITAFEGLQQGRGFARFSPAPDRDLANVNTYAGRKTQGSRGLPRCSRPTTYSTTTTGAEYRSQKLQRPLNRSLRFLPARQLLDIRHPSLEVRVVVER